MVKYKKWRKEELIGLLDGILKYGVGKWSLILKDPQFTQCLINRSYTNLKDKWRNLGVTHDESKIITLRRDLMDTPPLKSKTRSKKRSKKEVVTEEVSDCENYHNQCTVTPQRRGTRKKPVNQTKKLKLNSEKVYDNLMHQDPVSSEKISGNELIEELSDTEYYHVLYTITPHRKETRSNTINQCKKSNFEKGHDNFPHQSSLSTKELSKKELVEDLSDSGHYIPYTITRQKRGTRSNMNQDRKLNSDKVHSYLENLWSNFPEDKKSSFTHLDPLWYTLYSNDSNKERVLNWIQKKDVFSRKYVIFPIVQWSMKLTTKSYQKRKSNIKTIKTDHCDLKGHWNVLIFCHFGETIGSKDKSPCILLLDSLEKTEHSKQLEPIIRKFVSDIYKKLEMTEDIKTLRKIPFLVPKVPQQRDDEECGFFVLYYIKLFVENAPESFDISDGYPFFMKKDWFNFEELDSFCKTVDLSPK